MSRLHLVFATWHSDVPIYFAGRAFTDGPVWLAEGWQETRLGGGPPPQGSGTTLARGTMLEAALLVVNASTGQASTEEIMY